MTRYLIFAVLAGVIAVGCHLFGQRGAAAYERMLVQRVETGLEVLDFDWARIEADGLHLGLHGHAPDLFARELALESARATAPIARIDNFATAALAPPEHRDPVRVELHRDQRGVTMTGQTATREMRERLNRLLTNDGPTLTIHDLTGIQAQKPPRGWGAEIRVATLAASRLPNAYVVIEPGEVMIEGQAADQAERDALTRELLERAGESVSLKLGIRTPAVVIVPFAFSAYKDAGASLVVEQCTARTQAERTAILAALRQYGGRDTQIACPVGLGGPRGGWAALVLASIEALEKLPAGRVDVEYRTARLTGAPPCSPHVFGGVLQDFLAALPDGFDGDGALRTDDVATRTEIARSQFWMRLNREGEQLTLTGQVPSPEAATAIRTYAAAQFGLDQVKPKLAIVEKPAPARWQSTAMGLIDHLAATPNGEVEMAGHRLSVNMTVSDPREARKLHRDLLDLSGDYQLKTAITVDLSEQFASIALPPVRCAADLNRVNHAAPVDFDPGSAVITQGSRGVLDDLATLLKRCANQPIEVQGHTDAKGSEALNLRISQGRAEAVQRALLKRGVPAARMVAKGYGETVPIADNKTEEGRARNRRIEFSPAS